MLRGTQVIVFSGTSQEWKGRSGTASFGFSAGPWRT